MELNYKSFGQGLPIIILHGMFGTLDNWQTIARHLAANYTVFILDQRNHGRSPHTPDINYELLADDLHEFMEQHWIYRACIIGHSMGGKTAMQFALQYPDMAAQLIVVDMAPKQYPGSHHDIFEALFSIQLETVTNRKEVEAALEPKVPDNAVRQFLLKNLTRNKEGGYRWKMNLAAIYEHYDEILAAPPTTEQFDGPTLFIRGERSDYIQDNDWEGIQQHFPNAQLATIPNAGHWLHSDFPQAFITSVREFMRQHP